MFGYGSFSFFIYLFFLCEWMLILSILVKFFKNKKNVFKVEIPNRWKKNNLLYFAGSFYSLTIFQCHYYSYLLNFYSWIFIVFSSVCIGGESKVQLLEDAQHPEVEKLNDAETAPPIEEEDGEIENVLDNSANSPNPFKFDGHWQDLGEQNQWSIYFLPKEFYLLTKIIVIIAELYLCCKILLIFLYLVFWMFLEKFLGIAMIDWFTWSESMNYIYTFKVLVMIGCMSRQCSFYVSQNPGWSSTVAFCLAAVAFKTNAWNY